MKKSAWDWTIIFYKVLIVTSGLLVSSLIATELVRHEHDLLPILHFLGLAVIFYGLVDLSSLSFRDVEVSLSFLIVLVASLLLVSQFPDAPRAAVLTATGLAILGSLLSESLRRLLGPHLPLGRSLVRILFYAAHHALAGFIAAQAYLDGNIWELGQNLEDLYYIQPALIYTLVYALVYALASWFIVAPHDFAISRLLLPANEKRLPRVDLLTLVIIAPISLLPFYFLSGEEVWVLVVISFLFLAFLVVTSSYVNIDAEKRSLKAKENLRQQLENLINMRELVRQVHAILSKEIDYQWAAIYSAAPDRSIIEAGTTAYYLRAKLEKTKADSDIFDYGSIMPVERRGREPATVTKELPSEQVVGWPFQVLSGEGDHLGKVASTGAPSQNFKGTEEEPPASGSDPYLPPQIIAVYLPVQHEEKTIGLLALTRPRKRFTERERKPVERLAEAMSDSLQRIQRLEAQLKELYDNTEEYTTDPDRFQRAMQQLAEGGVKVFLILDSIMQSTFRNNVLSVMKGIAQPDGTAKQEKIPLSETELCEIYKEVRQKEPDMPPLNKGILENLKLIPSSLSLAFSFRYQWPRFSRGPDFTELYEFLVKAMEVRSMPDIVRLHTEELDATIKSLHPEKFAKIIGHLEGMMRVINDLKQDLLYEAMDKTAKLKESVSKNIEDPEKFIFLTLLGTWQTIMNATITEREGVAQRGEAQLKMALRNKRALPLVPVTIGLRLENVGPGTAFQVTVEMLSSTDYRVIGQSQVDLGLLPPLKICDLEFMLEPKESHGLRLSMQFQITYRDRAQKQIPFDDTLYLREAPPPFTSIHNPYIPGRPLRTDSPVFFGREDIFRFINQNMIASASQQRILLLIGERRVGKTSILTRLPARVKDKGYIHVFLDCQTIEGTPNVPSFFQRLAADICNALAKEGFSIDRLSDDDLRRDTYLGFEQKFLPQVWEKIGDHRLLIAVDEFERLDRYVREGKMEGINFAAALRALMQSQDRLAFIFAGTHQLEALFFEYWSVLFNMAQQKTIGFLSKEEARRLITEPVREHRVYDDLALDEILRATTGHPFFLQLICDCLMNFCNTKRHSYVTIEDVREALEDILATEQAHLTFIWNESDPIERDALAGLAKSVALDPRATVETIARRLEKASRPRTQPDLRGALRRLEIRRHIVTREQGPGEVGYYNFAAGLYKSWIQKHRSLD